jgi:hypothetical protein
MIPLHHGRLRPNARARASVSGLELKVHLHSACVRIRPCQQGQFHCHNCHGDLHHACAQQVQRFLEALMCRPARTIWRRTRSWPRGCLSRMRFHAGCRAQRAPSSDKRRSAPLRLARIVRCTPDHPRSLAALGGCVGRNHCARPASRWGPAGPEVQLDRVRPVPLEGPAVRVDLLHPEGPAVPQDRLRPSSPADLEGQAVRLRRVGLVVPAASA